METQPWCQPECCQIMVYFPVLFLFYKSGSGKQRNSIQQEKPQAWTRNSSMQVSVPRPPSASRPAHGMPYCRTSSASRRCPRKHSQTYHRSVRQLFFYYSSFYPPNLLLHPFLNRFSDSPVNIQTGFFTFFRILFCCLFFSYPHSCFLSSNRPDT